MRIVEMSMKYIRIRRDSRDGLVRDAMTRSKWWRFDGPRLMCGGAYGDADANPVLADRRWASRQTKRPAWIVSA